MLHLIMAFFAFFVQSSCNAERPTGDKKLAAIPHFDQKIKASDVAPIKIKVLDVKTPKGQKAWFVKTTEVPVVTIEIVFRHAGSKAEPKDKKGLVDILVPMLSKGAGGLSSQMFKEKLLAENIQLSCNATKDDIVFSFRTVKENVGKALSLIKLILEKPQFEAALLTHEKNTLLLDLKQMLELYNVKIKHEFGKMILGDHPYHQDLSESLKSVPNITADDLRAYMKAHFGRDNIVIAAVGDINQDELLKQLDDALSVISDKAQPNKVEHVKFQNGGKVLSIPFDISQSMILFSQPGVRREDPDYYPMIIINMVVGDLGVVGSRLMREIREKKGLAYDISCGMGIDDHNEVIGGGAGTLKPQEVIEETIRIIKDVRENGITEDELELAKRLAIQSYSLQFSSTGSICSTLASYQIDNRSPDYLNTRNEKIANVTLEDVRRAAKRLSLKNMAFAVIGLTDKVDTKKIESMLTNESSPPVPEKVPNSDSPAPLNPSTAA